jgi:lipase chaperone LimK
MKNERDYEINPITADEAISFFNEELFDLSLASLDVIKEASQKLEEMGMFGDANDIFARYDDYQEELRIMMMEFM